MLELKKFIARAPDYQFVAPKNFRTVLLVISFEFDVSLPAITAEDGLLLSGSLLLSTDVFLP